MDKNKAREQLDALEQEMKRREDVKILTEYYPRSFHWEFLTNWRKQRRGCVTNLFIGSNQSGKTFAGAILLRDIALGHHPWIKNFAKHVVDNWEELIYPLSGWWFRDQNGEEYFDNPKDCCDYIMSFELIDIRTPSLYAMSAKDFSKGIGTVFWPKLQEIVPGPYKDGPYIKNVIYLQGRVPSVIEWQNGSKTVFFSGEQDTFRYEGGTWDAIGWDEPPKQSHYVAMKRGALVKRAPMFFYLTPLSEPWIFDTLMQDARDEGNSVSVSTCDLMSEEVDWMTTEAKEEFEREVFREDPHQVEARVHGKFTHLLGRIYPTYDENVHFIPHAEIEQRMLTTVTYGVTVDPHDRRPFAIGWWFVDPLGDIYFYKNYPLQPMPEIKSCDLTVKDYANMIKDEQSALRDKKITFFFGDPNKFPTVRKTNLYAGQTLIDDFGVEKLYFDVEINDSIAEGHRTVRSEYLHYDIEKPIDHKNKPKIFVSTECANIHASMMKYTWDEKKSKDVASEIPHEKYKDFADVVRYTCIKHPYWVDPGVSMIYTPEVQGRIY